MVVCKFFQQGNCKFGRNCRYEHTKSNSYQNNNNENDFSRRNRYDNSRNNSNFIRPSQFRGNNQPQQSYSSPFNRQAAQEVNDKPFNAFQEKKNDKYHWSSPATKTSNRFAPLSDHRSEMATTEPANEDQALIQSIHEDFREWTNSSMWPYSVYSIVNKPCIDGLADIQPEELRTLFYLHGKDIYVNLIREVDNMYTSRKSELLMMSDETRMAVLSNLHSNADSNPSSCLTIFTMYGPGADFKLESGKSSNLLKAGVRPVEVSPSTPVFKPPQAPLQPSSTESAVSIQPVVSLFKTGASVPSSVSTSRDQDKYTDESILTESEISEFKAESFTLGKIPMRPPPESYCK